EDFLHFPRVDVEPAGDDEVLLAVDDVEVSFFVHAGDVARPQPAVPQGGGRLVGAVPVALHHLGPFDEQLAVLAYEHVRAGFGVDDAAVSVGPRQAEAAHLAPAPDGVGMGDGRGLGEPVAFHQPAARRGAAPRMQAAMEPRSTCRARGWLRRATYMVGALGKMWGRCFSTSLSSWSASKRGTSIMVPLPKTV